MKLPINFEQFSKDPVKGLFFLVICAVGYLYVDNRINYTNQIENCSQEVHTLSAKIDILDEKLHKSDSTLARATAKLEMLNELNQKK
jgi:outer membrane murein-binding lipoprotein Lpp